MCDIDHEPLMSACAKRVGYFGLLQPDTANGQDHQPKVIVWAGDGVDAGSGDRRAVHPDPLMAPLSDRLYHWSQCLALLGEPVLDSHRRLRVDAPLKDPGGLQ